MSKTLPDLLRVCEAATQEMVDQCPHQTLTEFDNEQFCKKCVRAAADILIGQSPYLSTFSPLVVRHLLQVIEQQREALRQLAQWFNQETGTVLLEPVEAQEARNAQRAAIKTTLDHALALPLMPEELR